MRRVLLPHASDHASLQGAGKLVNGELLAFAAARGYEGLVTVDQQMEHEHRLTDLPLPLLILAFRDVRPTAMIADGRAVRAAVLHLKTHRFVKLDDRGVVTKLHPLDEHPPDSHRPLRGD